MPVSAARKRALRSPDVLGVAEGAALLGVSRQRFNVLSRRAGFPRPTELACGPVWTRRQLTDFNENRGRA
jgi:hypothetical protein